MPADTLTPLGYERACLRHLEQGIAVSPDVMPPSPFLRPERVVGVRLEGHYPDARIRLEIEVEGLAERVIIYWEVWSAWERQQEFTRSPKTLVANLWGELGSDVPKAVAKLRASGSDAAPGEPS